MLVCCESGLSCASAFFMVMLLWEEHWKKPNKCGRKHFLLRTVSWHLLSVMEKAWGSSGQAVLLTVLKKFKKNVYLFLAVLGLHHFAWALPCCSKQGLLSGCSTQASHCSGFSCYGTWAVECEGSVVVVDGFSELASHEIFLNQGSNWCLLHWQVDSLPLDHQGSPS